MSKRSDDTRTAQGHIPGRRPSPGPPSPPKRSPATAAGTAARRLILAGALVNGILFLAASGVAVAYALRNGRGPYLTATLLFTGAFLSALVWVGRAVKNRGDA